MWLRTLKDMCTVATHHFSTNATFQILMKMYQAGVNTVIILSPYLGGRLLRTVIVPSGLAIKLESDDMFGCSCSTWLPQTTSQMISHRMQATGLHSKYIHLNSDSNCTNLVEFLRIDLICTLYWPWMTFHLWNFARSGRVCRYPLPHFPAYTIPPSVRTFVGYA